MSGIITDYARTCLQIIVQYIPMTRSCAYIVDEPIRNIAADTFTERDVVLAISIFLYFSCEISIDRSDRPLLTRSPGVITCALAFTTCTAGSVHRNHLSAECIQNSVGSVDFSTSSPQVTSKSRSALICPYWYPASL